MQIVNQQLWRSPSCLLPTLLLLHCLCKRPSVGCQFLPRSPVCVWSLPAVCASVRSCVRVCVTVTCGSALPSERHTNRWGVERPRAILWQKRFPSFVRRADGSDGLVAQHRPDQRAATIAPSLHTGCTNEHGGTSSSLPSCLFSPSLHLKD